MATDNKTRVVLSLNADVWREFQDNLRRKGYPRGTASWVVQQHLEFLNVEFDALGDSQQIQLLFPKK